MTLRKISLLTTSILLSVTVNFLLSKGIYQHIFILFWILAIIFLLSALAPQFQLEQFFLKRKLLDKKFLANKMLLLLLFLFPVAFRASYIDSERIHADGFITAYFSANYDFTNTNFFAGVPPQKGWVTQFPSIFFILQAAFFKLFGENPQTARLSTLPYVFIVAIFTYLIVKEIFNRKIALLSILMYNFFAVSLYLETLGLHFISSTAIFSSFFFVALAFLKKRNLFLAALLGVLTGFCYLLYTSSYMAFPLTIFIFVALFLKKGQRQSTINNFLVFLLAFSVTFGPFATGALKHGNYFLERYNQVKLVRSQGSITENSNPGTQQFLVVKKSLKDSLSSLYKDGIGGHGGYEFGRLALFDRFSFYLFVLGLIGALAMMLKRRELAFLVLVIIISFLFGMVLTIQPPAYHRFSVAFPFLIVVMTIPLYWIFSINRLSEKSKYTLALFLVGVYSFANLSHFNRAIRQDLVNQREDLDDVKIIRFIQKNFPNRKIYIAAFPSFALEKVFYFYDKNIKIKSDFHDNLLRQFNRYEKYVYIILFPEEYERLFLEKDKQGRIIRGAANKYSSIFAN